MKTDDVTYTRRLTKTVWWKRLLDVQYPYRRHLRGLNLGRVLDVGCGIGRNLVNLGSSADAVGVDHNPTSIAVARASGLVAFTSTEFVKSDYAQRGSFDSILIAHVLEHMTVNDARQLLSDYLPYLKDGGRVIVITPQEAGFKSDPTHISFMDHKVVEQIMVDNGLVVFKQYSFPFFRLVGKLFKYNEFVSEGRKKIVEPT